MRSRVFKRSFYQSAGALVSASVFSVLAVAGVLYGVRLAESASVSEGRRILEDGLRRAVATCYAIEGSYPQDLSYIEENYAIIIDRKKYAVFYEIEASNVFPDITVLESEEGF